MSVAKYGKMALKRYPAVRKRYRVYAPAVKQLASDVMYLKGLINSEPKFLTTQATNNIDFNGSVVSCCSIPQGDGESSRDGNCVLPRYFHIRGNVIKAIGSGDNHTTIRIIIFWSWYDSSNGTGSATAAETLATTGNQYAPFSSLKPSNTGPRGDRARRIEVLRSDLVTLDQVSKTMYDFEYNIEMNGKGTFKKEHIEFVSSSTAEPNSGGIYVLFISGTATGTQLQYVMESKVTFYDN